MQRLGLVLHISSSKNLILKAEKLPKIKESVVDENLRPVGVVSDVFGPVSSPYIAVKPYGEKPQRFVNSILYVFSSPIRRRKRRK